MTHHSDQLLRSPVAGVKRQGRTGETVPSVSLSELTETTTFPEGSLVRRTVKTASPPSSVTEPLTEETTKPADSSSMLESITSAGVQTHILARGRARAVVQDDAEGRVAVGDIVILTHHSDQLLRSPVAGVKRQGRW